MNVNEESPFLTQAIQNQIAFLDSLTAGVPVNRPTEPVDHLMSRFTDGTEYWILENGSPIMFDPVSGNSIPLSVPLSSFGSSISSQPDTSTPQRKNFFNLTTLVP